MNIKVSHTQGRVPVAILAVQGDLDASNYQELIAQAQQVYNAGTRHILVDLGNTLFVSSSGLVALHSIALLLKGERLPNLENGWATIRAVEPRSDSSPQQYIKLLNPQSKVDRVLEKAGLKEFFEIHTDLAKAIASF